MEPIFDYDLDPVSFITVDTQGPPGRRTFFLQGAEGGRVVSLVIEKEHAAALASSLERLLAAIEADGDDTVEAVAGSMALLTPVEPAFRVSHLGIGLDEERDRIVLVANERPPDEVDEGQRARFVATFGQMQALARYAADVVEQGRPVCDLCGEPMDPSGHFCPRRNGHATAEDV